MAITQMARCPLCGRLTDVIRTNNPLAASICADCIAKNVNPRNMEQVDMWCRTYNVPFEPTRWVELVEREGEKSSTLFLHYLMQWDAAISGTDDVRVLWRHGDTKDLWGEVNAEWERCGTFTALLERIEPIKEQFMARARVKWGANYSFEELMQLESLLVSTVRAADISNPLQIDAIKKACRISLALDQAINDGDAKAIKDLSSSYSAFTKTAQIDEVIATANKDVISTVAELGEFIEQCGGRFEYYDGVSRDIVDTTINDIKQYIRTLVEESTGISTTLETIKRNYNMQVESAATDQATSSLSLEELMSSMQPGANDALDDQLAADESTLTVDDIDALLFEQDDDPSDGNAATDWFGGSE